MKEKKRVKVNSREVAQALSEFLYKEAHRHIIDVRQIFQDLRKLEKKWGVKPTGKYVDVWIEP